MNVSILIAQDETGKVAAIAAENSNQTQKLLDRFHDDKQLKEAGLVGKVEVAILRDPLGHFERRETFIKSRK